MVKLAGLVDGMAAALQVAPSRVRTAAAQLRKHKLLSTGPRGPGAPEMTPRDAANLLLAVMYDDELTTAHESVGRLRAASFAGCRHHKFGEPDDRRHDFPRNGFVGSKNVPLSVGQVLETILDWFVRYGSLDEGVEQHDTDVFNLTVTVAAPSYGVTIHFNTFEGFWDLTYAWKSPQQIEYEAANPDEMLRRSWHEKAGPQMWSSRTVYGDSLRIIADCLRGCEWDDDWERFDPPYNGSRQRQLAVGVA